MTGMEQRSFFHPSLQSTRTIPEGDRYSLTAAFSRRQLISGSLGVGIALAAGTIFTRSSAPLQPDELSRKRVVDVNWTGIDFAWLPDSMHLACVGPQGLSVINRQYGQLTRSQKDWPGYNYAHTSAISWSMDKTRVLYQTDAALLVQDVERGENLWTYILPTPSPVSSTWKTTLSPDGTYLAILEASTTSWHVQLWNVQTKALHWQFSGEASSNKNADAAGIIWSPDGIFLASTLQDGSVSVRTIADGQILWSYNAETSGRRQALSWSPDGSTILFRLSGQKIGLWDAQTGQVRLQTEARVDATIVPGTKITGFSWSPDGSRFALETEKQGRPGIEIWSVSTGQPLFTCQPVSGQPTGITWSPDGSYLAAGNYIVGSGKLSMGDNGDRSQIQFWDARNGKAIFAYNVPKSPERLTWSPDSRYLALITPGAYGPLATQGCFAECSYGYYDYALQAFLIG